AQGYFLAANTTLTLPATRDLDLAANTFENDDNVTHMLVKGLLTAPFAPQTPALTTLLNFDIDANEDSVIDASPPAGWAQASCPPWQAIRDKVAVIKEPNGAGVPPPDTECHYGSAPNPGPNVIVGPSGTTSPTHVLVCPPSGQWVIGTADVTNGNDTP